MTRKSVTSALKTMLEGIANVVVKLTATDPEEHWHQFLESDWPDGTDDLLVVYPHSEENYQVEHGKTMPQKRMGVRVFIFVKNDDAEARCDRISDLIEAVELVVRTDPTITQTAVGGDFEDGDYVDNAEIVPPYGGYKLNLPILYYM